MPNRSRGLPWRSDSGMRSIPCDSTPGGASTETVGVLVKCAPGRGSCCGGSGLAGAEGGEFFQRGDAQHRAAFQQVPAHASGCPAIVRDAQASGRGDDPVDGDIVFLAGQVAVDDLAVVDYIDDLASRADGADL